MTDPSDRRGHLPLRHPDNLKVVPRLFPPLVGALAISVGCMTLVGWALDIGVLKSIRPDWVSMKPNTALSFVLTGLAMLLLTSRPATASLEHSALVVRMARLFAFLAGLIGLLSLIEYAMGLNLGLDQWLFREPAGAVGTSHPARMAPDTAVSFMLLAVGLGWSSIRLRRPWVLATAIIGALVTTMALVEILSYLTPDLRAAGWGGLTMMALPTATLFAALGASLLLIVWQEGTWVSASNAKAPKGPSSHAGLGLALVFLLLAIGITAIGISSFRNYDRHIRIRAEADLMAIADLKVGELVRWRKERLGDGGTLYDNPAFSTLVQRLFENSDDTEARRLLVSWLEKLQDQFDYEQIVLVDTAGAVRLSVPEGSSSIPHLGQDAVDGLSSGQMSFLDFHRHTPDSPARLGVVIPLFEDREGGQPLGLVALSIDPETYLYPYIQRWPTPSPSAETLIVRREGNDVLFLNELRFQPNAALNLRVSLDRKELPAVMVASGMEGVVEGIDYRGVPVLAALRAVPDSPWFLVARKDAEEVFAPLRERLWVTVLFIAFLLALSGGGIGLIWWWQGVRFYREQADSAEKLQRSESLLARAEHLGKTGAWEFDIDTQKQTWSDMVYQIHEVERGVDPTVDQGVSFYTPESRPIIERAVQEAIEQGKPFDVELEIITAKGNHRQVHTIGTADLERRTVSGFFQDITERKAVESALLQSEATIRNKLKAIIEPDGDIDQLDLSDIIDIEILRSMMEDFYQVTGMLGAVLDLSGQVLIAVGWQDICMKFHRCHPDTLKHCIESDTTLTNEVEPGTFRGYRCKNNMWDMVTPLIVGGRHIGNVFIGQFFYEDETPDVELFRGQARRYGFDETEYLAALDRVPRFSREVIEAGMQFYATLAEVVSTLSFSAIQQSRMLAERERAGEALKESEGRLRDVQKMAQLGHWHWDVSTGSVEWSEEVYNIFRLDPETFTPQIDSILALSPWPEENARDQELISRAIASHEKGDYEQRFLRPDGSSGYYHSTFQGSYDDTGRLIAIVGSIMDITERKAAEEEIRTLNQSLERRVQERTAELLASVQELDSFAYAVTHDLRAPLRAMSGFSQALVEDYGETIPEEGRGFLDQITEASHRMGNLIEGLLKLSRSTRGTMRREVVDLSALATRLLAELWAEDPDRRMFSIVTPGMTAWGDEGMIEVVLANLLGNAWKYTAKTPEPKIEFGVKEKGDDSGPGPTQHSTVFFIRDNGAGFDPKHSAKLFQPFQRLHREEEFPGIGIGLATAQRIVLRHGGTMSATAELGRGATFFFSLSPSNVTNEVES